MDVRAVVDAGELGQLRTSWEALFDRDPDAHYFLSWRWMEAARRAHPDGWQVLVVRPDDAEDPVCVFPTRIESRWSESRATTVDELTMAGRRSWAQYNGLLCDPDWEGRAIPALARHIAESSVTRLALKYFRVSDARWTLFAQSFPESAFRLEDRPRLINDGAIDNLVCPYVDLPDDFDEYLTGQVSRSTRQKIRRHLRKIADDDAMTLDHGDATDLDRDLDALLGLWEQQWASRRGDRTPRLLRKYEEILRLSADCGALHLAVLRREGTAIGALAAFHDDRTRCLHYIVSARDISDDVGFIGWALHGDTIRWGIDHGVTRYDFCHGNEPYKYSYGCTDRRVRYTYIRRRRTSATTGPAVEEIAR